MSDTERERLRGIKTFPSLVKYLREELDWPIETEKFDDLIFDYEAEELGIDPKVAVKIDEIKQLRPLVSNQPWGIFFIKFEPKQLPVVVLRRILSKLVFKKRASANKSEHASWNLGDLLFISSYGEGGERQINLAHFAENQKSTSLPTLKVLGWDEADRDLKIDHVRNEMQEKLRWPEDLKDLESWRAIWASAFTLRHREVITTSKMLAERLAELASAIRNRVNKVLPLEQETGPLRKLLEAFREALVHDLTEDGFADMYAQTISYGLLSERLLPKRDEGGSLGLGSLKAMNPLLGELLDDCRNIGRKRGLIDFDELGVGDVENLLNDPATRYDDILRDFDNRNPAEDPVIHFYEHFLREYDTKRRIQRGVFYTPKPVVSFIVRSVDKILRTEFGLIDGLADTTTWGEMLKRYPNMKLPAHTSESEPFVQILDPATGTGTFLVEVIEVIHKTMIVKWQKQGYMLLELNKLWNEYVSKALLPRLYGFEIMMAPYAIAHMKIGLKLVETGYQFQSDQRAQVYLTNTLELAQDFSGMFEQMAPALAHEIKAVNEIKTNVPATVIIGNPPYSKVSYNMSEWAQNLPKLSQIDNVYIPSFYEYDGKPLNERKLNLQDDYVKFIRYGQFLITRSNTGIFGMITNHGYLEGPTFRGMRQSLLSTYGQLYIIDLHGDSNIGENVPIDMSNENVFDIQQGVSINLFASSVIPKDSFIRSFSLWGTRDEKFKKLIHEDVSTLSTQLLDPQPPYYVFVPGQGNQSKTYEQQTSLTEIMSVSISGIVTSRDHLVIGFSEEEILTQIVHFLDPQLSDIDVARELNLKENYAWRVSDARRQLRSDPSWTKRFIDLLYRPFDIRRLLYHPAVVWRPRESGMKHMLSSRNIGLIATRQSLARFSHIGITRNPIEYKTGSHHRNTQLFPLYVESPLHGLGQNEYREPNISETFIKKLVALTGLSWINSGHGNLRIAGTIGPDDVINFIYAQLHSQTYRDLYGNYMKMDFPRIFITSNVVLLNTMCQIGA